MAEDFEEFRARVVGTRFPGGTFTVEEYERWLAHDAMQSPELPPGVLHPVWVLLGALRGMGLTTDELTAIADAGAHDGTMFGETLLEQHEVLRTGVEYSVRGGVTELVRKQSQRVGRMDLMTFRLEIVDPAGSVAAVSEQVFIFPRRSGIHAE
ncbi:hypothetical protein BH11ACT4_BH11ACT4_08320 [soil metagenome]